MAELAELAKTYFAPDGPLFKAMSAPGGALTDEEVWHSPRAPRRGDPRRQRHLRRPVARTALRGVRGRRDDRRRARRSGS